MQDEVFKQNLTTLTANQPEAAEQLSRVAITERVQVIPSRRGAPTLALGGVQLHSAYDPVSEAEKQAASVAVSVGLTAVVFGLGLGYFAQALRTRFNGKLVIIEPDTEVAAAAFASNDLGSLGEFHLILASSSKEIILALESVATGCGGWDKLAFVEHPPSARIHQALIDEVKAAIRGRSNAISGPLSILVATPLYGGSLPIAHYCTSAFRRLGHKVETLDNTIYDPVRMQIDDLSSDKRARGRLAGLMVTLMAESILARALDRAVDLVWLVAQSPMTPGVAASLKKAGIPTAFWFVEEWQLLTYWQEWAPIYDYFFHIQQGAFSKALNERGVKRGKYLPLAADPFVHRSLDLNGEEIAEYGSEASHIGAGYRNRRQVFSGFKDFEFKLWGNDWDGVGVLAKSLQRGGARLSTEESIKVFNATKVNINLHSSQFHDGVNPDGDYLNPRTFEIASCDAFQLVDHRTDLASQFTPGEEMVTFRDAAEIPSMVKYYLDHESERQAVADRSRKRVLEEHTYDLRMQEALQHILSHEPSRASHRHPNHIDNLIAGAGDQPDLLELLEQLRGQGVVTLEDIIGKIASREGDLSRAEMIFLLMHEFRKWASEKEIE